jgi:two-component system, cell cycle response regulator DivK
MIRRQSASAPSRKKVLLVEDDAESRAALQQILEDDGFMVMVAADGDEGVDVAVAFQPDVILLDLVLPHLNGFDAAALLKRDEATSRIPLVAVTASWIGSESSRLREIGFETSLRKPFHPRDLLDVVEMLSRS